MSTAYRITPRLKRKHYRIILISSDDLLIRQVLFSDILVCQPGITGSNDIPVAAQDLPLTAEGPNTSARPGSNSARKSLDAAGSSRCARVAAAISYHAGGRIVPDKNASRWYQASPREAGHQKSRQLAKRGSGKGRHGS
jgi:hypothetical protein